MDIGAPLLAPFTVGKTQVLAGLIHAAMALSETNPVDVGSDWRKHLEEMTVADPRLKKKLEAEGLLAFGMLPTHGTSPSSSFSPEFQAGQGEVKNP